LLVSTATGGKVSTLFAKWLAAGSIPQVLTLDIVSGVAIGVVVMHRLFYRMPRTCNGHPQFTPFL